MNRFTFTFLWVTSGFLLLWALLSAPHSDADPTSQDPHEPNWSIGWCPGGGPGIRLGATALPTNGGSGVWGYCDGVPYEDNTYLHQVPQLPSGFSGFGTSVQTFCRVGQGSLWSPPAPPGGCGGLQS